MRSIARDVTLWDLLASGVLIYVGLVFIIQIGHVATEGIGVALIVLGVVAFVFRDDRSDS